MQRRSRSRFRVWVLWIILLCVSLAACSKTNSAIGNREPVKVALSVDGGTEQFSTKAGNVREFLEEAGISYSESDIIDPPPFTALTADTDITITRVSERIEVLESVIPFERRTVRNETMSAEDAPVIIQSGSPGMQEITVRIVYHDSIEFSRNETQVTVIEPAVDEIVMIGLGAAPGSVDFEGYLAMISDGSGVIMRGSSSFAETMNTGGDLDNRVFALSPNGSHLLFTRATTGTDTFNTLWVVSTERGDLPRSLGIENVLWADWNPAEIDELQFAYTTAEFSDIPPGWEANNDLWMSNLPLDRFAEIEPVQLIESYPATYGWWGGSYAWSPNGRYIAYSYADEIGLVDNYFPDSEDFRRQLITFTEFNTRADWVWVPPLAWSPDSNYLAFTRHSSTDPTIPEFDTWVINVEDGVANRFVDRSGIWSTPKWSPLFSDPMRADQDSSQIAFLKSTNPSDSQSSSYTLWMMDRDGSNLEQLYPATGENSRFPRGGDFMTWGPSGREIAFIYGEALYFLDLDSGDSRRITQDDSSIRNPSWAPYGPHAQDLLQFGEGLEGALQQLTERNDIPSE